MRWISKDENLKGYITNSTGKGNYNEDENANAWKGIWTTTGKSTDYAVKNIYDMAGNVSEWTMEACSTSYRVFSGGYYHGGGSDLPVSDRGYSYPSASVDIGGFRVVLYL